MSADPELPAGAAEPELPAGAADPELRAASAADLDALHALETRLFASDAWSRSMLREELTGELRSYVVLADPETGAVLGYAGVLTVGTEADIQTIAVVPELRGRGQGRRLMRQLLATAAQAGAREVFLEVRADNPVARGLYDSLGFAEIGVRPRYYQPDGVDAIVMRHELKDT